MTTAPILTPEQFSKIENLGRIVCTSGGWDPIHPGHVSCIVESKQYGDTLVAVVNGDWFLTNKKGRPFMPVMDRCQIVSAIRGVDFVVRYDAEETTVSGALEIIKPNVFTKGGDRTAPSNIPEWATCVRLGIQVITGVGYSKQWSSSDYLKRWSQGEQS